jgi:hypothetical protein
MFSVVMPASAALLPPAQNVPAQNGLSGVGSGLSSGANGVGTPTASLSSCSHLADNGVSGVVGCIAGFFNTAIYLIISAAVVYIVWGAFTMIRSEEKREEGKKIILYGVVGLFVMVSIWGFVNILVNTFGTDRGQIDIPALIK